MEESKSQQGSSGIENEKIECVYEYVEGNFLKNLYLELKRSPFFQAQYVVRVYYLKEMEKQAPWHSNGQSMCELKYYENGDWTTLWSRLPRMFLRFLVQ